MPTRSLEFLKQTLSTVVDVIARMVTIVTPDGASEFPILAI